MSLRRYTKALVAIVGGMGISWGTLLNDGQIVGHEWVLIADAIITAIGVYYFPNVVQKKDHG